MKRFTAGPHFVCSTTEAVAGEWVKLSQALFGLKKREGRRKSWILHYVQNLQPKDPLVIKTIHITQLSKHCRSVRTPLAHLGSLGPSTPSLGSLGERGGAAWAGAEQSLQRRSTRWRASRPAQETGARALTAKLGNAEQNKPGVTEHNPHDGASL